MGIFDAFIEEGTRFLPDDKAWGIGLEKGLTGGRPDSPVARGAVDEAIDRVPGGNALLGNKGVPNTLMGVDNSGNPSILSEYKESIPGYQHGCNGDGKHQGVDVTAATGTPIRAWYDYEVMWKQSNHPVNGPSMAVYYPQVNATIQLLHNQPGSMTGKSKGQKGDILAKIGTPAQAEGTKQHVHYFAKGGKHPNPWANPECDNQNPKAFYDGKKSERSGGAAENGLGNLPNWISQGIVSGIVGIFKWLFGKLILQPFDWLSGFSYEFLSNMWDGFTDTDASRPAFGPYNRQRLYLLGFAALTYQLVWGRTPDGQGRLQTSIEQIGNGVNRTFGQSAQYRTRNPQSVNFESDYMGETTAKVNRGQTLTTKARVKAR